MEDAKDWRAQLREYVSACRITNPFPSRDDLTPAEEWQCRIVGSALLAWLRNIGPQFLQERAVLCELLEIDPDPLIVFTSNIPGLIAAREIVGPEDERVVYLMNNEFSIAPSKEADPNYKRHVHVWSFFCLSVEPGFAAEAKDKYPIPDGCSYWQHSEGTMWAVNAGRGVDHLWQWDGHEPKLLVEAITSWVA